MKALVKQLKDYVNAHYDEGGHWVAETHSDEDYEGMIVATGSLESAKASLKDYWELQQERYKEISSLASW